MPNYERTNIPAEQDDEDEKEGKGRRQIDARGVQGIASQTKEMQEYKTQADTRSVQRTAPQQNNTQNPWGLASEQEIPLQKPIYSSPEHDMSTSEMMSRSALGGLGIAFVMIPTLLLAPVAIIPGAIGLLAVGAAIGAMSGFVASVVKKIIAKHNMNKAKRIIKKQTKEKIKENKNEIKKQKEEIKKLKQKRKEELKKAKSKEEKAEIKEKYEALISKHKHIIVDNKEMIAQEKEIAREKIYDIPPYKDCRNKAYLDPDRSVANVMVMAANEIYNREHGIKTVQPAAKPKQVQQQAARERVTLAEHKAERVTGMQQRKKDERVAGMRK